MSDPKNMLNEQARMQHDYVETHAVRDAGQGYSPPSWHANEQERASEERPDALAEKTPSR